MPTVSELLDSITGELAIPGAAIAAGTSREVVALAQAGLSQIVPEPLPLAEEAVWDLASLTKVVATTTSLAVLAAEGTIRFEDALSRYLPETLGGPLAGVTLRDLMTHTAGLPSWEPLYMSCRSREALFAAVLATAPEAAPGERCVYSDLGFILLGEVVARASGRGLERFAAERLFQPLGMADTGYCPEGGRAARCAATELDEDSGLPIRGVVHDENARTMGGVSGHAGLFSTARDLARFCQALLKLPGGPLGGANWGRVWAEVQREDRSGAAGDRRLGWHGVSSGDALAEVLTPLAYGHTGFTGTSMWLDPGRDMFVVLLTNAVHPTRDGAFPRVREARTRACRAVVEWVGERH